MEPKFQSSFIPKGPAATTVGVPVGKKNEKKGLVAYIAFVIFAASVLAALAIFGYKLYLKYRIEKMGADLETARANLQPEVIDELTSFDNRIISTKNLISRHQVLTPLFEFLETSIPRTVRFNDFRYTATGDSLEVLMRGEARSYAALALQADIFSKSPYFINPLFSDLNLNSKGDVSFSFKASVDPSLVSYTREVEGVSAPVTPPISAPRATSTATSSPPRATSTPN